MEFNINNPNIIDWNKEDININCKWHSNPNYCDCKTFGIKWSVYNNLRHIWIDNKLTEISYINGITLYSSTC